MIIALKRIVLAVDSLVIYSDLSNDEKVKALITLLETLTSKEPDGKEIYKAYHRFYRQTLNINWPCYIVELLLRSSGSKKIFPNHSDLGFERVWEENIARDLKTLQKLAQLSLNDLKAEIIKIFQTKIKTDDKQVFKDGLEPENWPEWKAKHPLPIEDKGTQAQKWLATQKNQILDRFLENDHWEKNIPFLLDYYRQTGYGIFNSYAAFSFNETTKTLEGIENPDPIRLCNLFAQEKEQAIVLRNTKSFLNGLPANNVILYGSRGTGKSSLVKALLNEYVDKGLRLVQLKKDQMKCYPELVRQLAAVPLKFIIFIDDLSFSGEEEDYKILKSLLEGGIEARPGNVLIYATSNRRHLVKESFADRRADDVHAHDTMDEKLSLADRFGITVTFLSPDQKTYLQIVEGLCAQEGLKIDKTLLRQKALQWVMMNNTSSGRTARQFVDNLKAKLASGEQI